MKNKTGLLIVAALLAVIAIGMEILRQMVAPRSADTAELVMGIEIFVWLFAGVALLRRYFISKAPPQSQ